ncbi:MAG TPA: hypothetical protein VN408_41840 [Actinoplanes sp.]|nr:hypothetical protein [Actinoplanes sp.]
MRAGATLFGRDGEVARLDSHAPQLSPVVRDRFLTEAAGNPAGGWFRSCRTRRWRRNGPANPARRALT